MQLMKQDIFLRTELLMNSQENHLPSAPNSRRPQVLIVDDMQENRELLARLLNRKGIECAEAEGSGSAIRQLTNKSFDLILLDIMMPGMDGSEFMQVIRHKYSQSELPIIMVTAKTSSEDVRYNFGIGANDYITKPVDWTVAFPRIEAQLKNKLEHDRKTYAYGEAAAEAEELRMAIAQNSEMLVRMNQRLALGLDTSNLLSDQQILELLLSNVVSRHDVGALAQKLLAAFGDLSGVVAAPERGILAVEGATDRIHLLLKLVETAALRMARARVIDRCAIASWDDLLRYCKTVMAHRSTEQVRVLYLDRKNVLIADEAQGEGTVDHVPRLPARDRPPGAGAQRLGRDPGAQPPLGRPRALAGGRGHDRAHRGGLPRGRRGAARPPRDRPRPRRVHAQHGAHINTPLLTRSWPSRQHV